MRLKIFLLLLLVCEYPSFSFAQDLMSILDSVQKPAGHEKVFATFKDSKVINAQSTETVKKRCLDFNISHRFGSMGVESGGGPHTLYGWDAISDVRFSFDYGITDNITIGIARNKRLENIDGTLKWRFLEQTADNHIPVSVAFYGNSAITPMAKSSFYLGTVNVSPKITDRIAYVSQLIIARKFTRYFSFEILPTYQHRNFVKALVNSYNGKEESNDLFALGAAMRLKLTRRMAILIDYFHVFSDYRKNNPVTPYYDPLAVGIEIETGGHVFHINVTNALGIIENDFIPNTTDSWTKGG
ncbi:MAG: hypothetical protein IT235_06365 [Bacteroidia bacterium]|nr:hypothetical protein [Bacteroidia bacterium]